MIAVHLLKHAYWMEDSQGRDMELRYFRDTDGREVDFALMENGKPTMFIECKLSDRDVSPALKYLCAKFPTVPACQVHLKGEKDFQTPEGIRVCPARVLLSSLT